jgi:hypothetical protein
MAPWEHHLLSDIVEYTESNFFGGDTDRNGTFGWAIATHNRILFENLGISPANQ